MEHKTFEECYDEIRDAVFKRRHKWKYKINHLDFEDVAAMIIHHIYLKWHLFDQSQPLLHYINRTVTNKMINLARDNYNSFLPPCHSCCCRVNDNECSLFGTQDKNQCGVLKKWHLAKKQESYNINLPVSIENHASELRNKSSSELDYSKIFDILQDRSKKILTNMEYIVFDLAYIQRVDEAVVLEKLGYKFNSTQVGKYSKQLETIKESIFKKVKRYLYSEDCDIIF